MGGVAVEKKVETHAEMMARLDEQTGAKILLLDDYVWVSMCRKDYRRISRAVAALTGFVQSVEHYDELSGVERAARDMLARIDKE